MNLKALKCSKFKVSVFYMYKYLYYIYLILIIKYGLIYESVQCCFCFCFKIYKLVIGIFKNKVDCGWGKTSKSV